MAWAKTGVSNELANRKPRLAQGEREREREKCLRGPRKERLSSLSSSNFALPTVMEIRPPVVSLFRFSCTSSICFLPQEVNIARPHKIVCIATLSSVHFIAMALFSLSPLSHSSVFQCLPRRLILSQKLLLDAVLLWIMRREISALSRKTDETRQTKEELLMKALFTKYLAWSQVSWPAIY